MMCAWQKVEYSKVESSPVSQISGMLVGSQQAVWYEVPKESAKQCSQRATTS